MSDEEYYRAKSSAALWVKLKPLAREMRHKPTPAENKLWQRIRGRQVQGAKFRRQHAIERFIIDFYCAGARLIIEVDGSIHEHTPDEDAIRQEFLEGLGFRVLRFKNAEILQSLDSVVEKISRVLADD